MDNNTILQRLEIPAGRLRLVIDTDAKNEVDDQYAIAWALRSPERFSVEAVYAAPFSGACFSALYAGAPAACAPAVPAGSPGEGMRKSYDEILRVFSLLGESAAGRVFYGAGRYLGAGGEPADSDAVRDLIARARASQEPLYVAACGVLTNIASALLLAPEIAQRLVVVWLGGQPLEFGHGIEFNLMQDVRAAQTVLDSGVPLVLIPCMNVASMLSASAEELERNLAGKNAICDYLYRLVRGEFADIGTEKAFMRSDRWGYLRGREDSGEDYLAQFPTQYISWSRILWDVAVVAFLKNPNWVLTKAVPAPVLRDDLSWETAARRHPIRIATYCWRNFIYGDLFHDLTR